MSAASLDNTQGIVALAALAVAVLALIASVVLMSRVRSLRAAQKLVLGDGAQQDVIAHSAALQEAFGALQEYVGDVAQHLENRLDDVELALTGAVAHQALVRYDAYNELSGQQSVSIALLDGRQSGVVLTCIHHRDQARVYAKQVREGRGELELSPEEAEAVRIALSEGPPSRLPGPLHGAPALEGGGRPSVQAAELPDRVDAAGP
ncbi:MAG TPA: DUF4446 family protein [Solirubrobacteraceae bacterium]|nr:DUF4446 family protein [Solirubrobacteraceae bacterium]